MAKNDLSAFLALCLARADHHRNVAADENTRALLAEELLIRAAELDEIVRLAKEEFKPK